VLLPAIALPAPDLLHQCLTEMLVVPGHALKGIAAGNGAPKRIGFASGQVMGNFTFHRQAASV
jgi:hypothetical protein